MLLYWAEGGKARNNLSFSNSELPMLSLFRRFITECFGIEDDRFVLRLNVYLNSCLSLDEVERFWLDGLELPASCARKHMVNHTPTSSSGKKTNKLPHGVRTLGILKSRYLLQHIYGAIGEYAGFEEPAWLG